MLEGKIVSDIIKMWDSMPMHKKEALRDRYVAEWEEFQRENDEDPKVKYMNSSCDARKARGMMRTASARQGK